VLGRIFDLIKPLYPSADSEYFTTHLAQETEHMREIIDLLVLQIERGGSIGEVVAGFDAGLASWEAYFAGLYTYYSNHPGGSNHPRRTHGRRESLLLDGLNVCPQSLREAKSRKGACGSAICNRAEDSVGPVAPVR